MSGTKKAFIWGTTVVLFGAFGLKVAYFFPCWIVTTTIVIMVSVDN